MRYKKLLFALLIILLPVVALAKDVSIKSVELVENSNFVEELSKPSYSGLIVNFDLKFHIVGDRAVYKVVLSNNDNENYFINLKTNSDSKYISYTIDSNESTNVVKSGKNTVFFIIVDYKNEVPSDLFVNNVYNENNNVKLLLTNNKGEEVIVDGSTKNAVVNPKTGNIVLKIKNTNITISLYTILIVLLLTIVLIVLLKRLRIKKYINMLLVLGLLIPGLVMAINEITIVINGKVEVDKIDFIEFTILRKTSTGRTKKYTYYAPRGMTFREWKDSVYNTDKIDISFYSNESQTCVKGNFIKDVSIVFYYIEDYCASCDAANVSNQNDYIIKPDTIIKEVEYELEEEDCVVNFTIQSGDEINEYYADKGMTWGEWLESEYNVDNIQFEGTKAPVASIPCSGFVYYLSRVRDSTENIESYDDIIERRDYYLIESVHLCTG